LTFGYSARIFTFLRGITSCTSRDSASSVSPPLVSPSSGCRMYRTAAPVSSLLPFCRIYRGSSGNLLQVHTSRHLLGNQFCIHPDCAEKRSSADLPVSRILPYRCAKQRDRLSQYLYAVLLLRTVLGLLANLFLVYSTEITPLMMGRIPFDVIFVILILWTKTNRNDP